MDSRSERLLQVAIDRYCASHPEGVTRIVIAHRLSTIMEADMILYVNRGAVVESGTHAVCINKQVVILGKAC